MLSQLQLHICHHCWAVLHRCSVRFWSSNSCCHGHQRCDDGTSALLSDMASSGSASSDDHECVSRRVSWPTEFCDASLGVLSCGGSQCRLGHVAHSWPRDGLCRCRNRNCSSTVAWSCLFHKPPAQDSVFHFEALPSCTTTAHLHDRSATRRASYISCSCAVGSFVIFNACLMQQRCGEQPINIH